MFPGLKCPTKVKSGQTRKYILVGTVSLTVMLMSCLTRFFSTLLKVHWLCGCILLLAAFHFLLLYLFRHQHESVHVWSFTSVVSTRFYRFRPIKPVADCCSSPRRTSNILNTSCSLQFSKSIHKVEIASLMALSSNNLPLPVGPLHSACISISCF